MRVLSQATPIKGFVATVKASYVQTSIFSGNPSLTSPSITQTMEYFEALRPLGVERRAFFSFSLIFLAFGKEPEPVDFGRVDFAPDYCCCSLFVFT